jgi:PilZ domain
MLLSRSHVTGYQTIFTDPQRINTEPNKSFSPQCILTETPSTSSTLTMNRDYGNDSFARQERRRHPRVKMSARIDLTPAGRKFATGAVTSDVSLGGCYIETMFPLPKGTEVEITLHVGEGVLAVGRVMTCDPNIGNGIMFTNILPEDREELRVQLEAAQRDSSD